MSSAPGLQKAKASDDMQRGDWNVQVARQQERLEDPRESTGEAEAWRPKNVSGRPSTSKCLEPCPFRNVILQNVTTSLSNMCKEKLRQKTLLLETGVVIPKVGQRAGTQHTKPEYDPKDFELCWPRANQELPPRPRQTTVDQAEKLNGISIRTDCSGQGIQWSSLQPCPQSAAPRSCRSRPSLQWISSQLSLQMAC